MRTSRAPSRSSRPRSTRLPRCGVAMKTTRRTSGRGLKNRARRNRSRSSGSPASSSNGRSLTSRHSRDPAVLDHHLRQQPAHAVPYHDRPVERRVGPVGVEPPPRLVEVAAQQPGRIQDRVARRVAEGPELVAVAEVRVGLQGLDHRGPRPRARPQAVDEDDRDPAPPVGPEEGQPRRLVAEEARDVRVGRRRRRSGRHARGRVRRPALGPGRGNRDQRCDDDRGQDGTHSLSLPQPLADPAHGVTGFPCSTAAGFKPPAFWKMSTHSR